MTQLVANLVKLFDRESEDACLTPPFYKKDTYLLKQCLALGSGRASSFLPLNLSGPYIKWAQIFIETHP